MVSQYLSNFKDRGLVAYNKILSIPSSERIPALIKEPDGFMRVTTAISASIKSAMDNINVRVGLTDDQVVEIACMIIEQSSEDYLALEDVLLFLREVLLGNMGKVNDRMDITIFFNLFEIYRQQRHKEFISIRREQHVQNKALPITDRYTDMSKDEERDSFRGAMKQYMNDNYNKNPT